MKRYWWLLILPAVLLLWWGFSRSRSAVVIHFSTAEYGSLSSVVPTNGRVEPAESSAARSEISGVVRSVLVERGQEVQAGQPLVALDTTAARADLASALAREQEAVAETHTLGQGGKAASVADLNDRIRSAQTAVAMAQRIYDADKRLLQQQAVTKLQVQADADALERAKLSVSAAQDQKRTAVTESDRTVAEAKLRDAQAAVAVAKHRVDLSVIRAPMSGTVYQLGDAAAGEIKVGTYLTPGMLVAMIGKVSQVKVTVYVDEPDLGRIGLGMPVSITSDSRPGETWSGKVDRLPTQVVPLQTRTVGEISTYVDSPRHDLLPGVSVDVRIISKVVNHALLIPKAALRRFGNTDGVYKLNGDVITWAAVKAGVSDVNNVQILSGLQQGERVADRVVDPPDAEIKDGMRVKPVFN